MSNSRNRSVRAKAPEVHVGDGGQRNKCIGNRLRRPLFAAGIIWSCVLSRGRSLRQLVQ